jgi:superfamily II DNA helicase RecQ
VRGEFALVYLAPEKVVCWGSQLARLAAGPGILMFAVDEAHW